MRKDWQYRRGDIYYADLGLKVGSEQAGIRPVLVIQNNRGNQCSPTLIVATITTKVNKKRGFPTHCILLNNHAFKKPSKVMLEQIRTIDKSRVERYLGKVTDKEMEEIENAILTSLALSK